MNTSNNTNDHELEMAILKLLGVPDENVINFTVKCAVDRPTEITLTRYCDSAPYGLESEWNTITKKYMITEVTE